MGKFQKIWMSAISVIAMAAVVLSAVAVIDINSTKKNSIPTVNDQIESINETLPKLEAVNVELNDYIAQVELTTEALRLEISSNDADKDALGIQLKSEIATAVEKLQKVLDDVKNDNEKLNSELTKNSSDVEILETELKNNIAEASNKISTELENAKMDYMSLIDALEDEITALKNKNTELEKTIGDVDKKLTVSMKLATDWANATFATLEQYKSLQTEITEIKNITDAINASMMLLEDRMNKKMADNIKEAVDSLSETLEADYTKKIESAANDIIQKYTSAIEKAKADITAAYESALATSIANSETAMKQWVNTTLQEGYYTIIQIDAKLAAMKSDDDSINAELAAQKLALENAKSEIEAAYTAAITTAINENNGVISSEIDSKISSAVSSMTTQLESKVSELKTYIDAKSNENMTLAQSKFATIEQYNELKSLIGGTGDLEEMAVLRVKLPTHSYTSTGLTLLYQGSNIKFKINGRYIEFTEEGQYVIEMEGLVYVKLVDKDTPTLKVKNYNQEIIFEKTLSEVGDEYYGYIYDISKVEITDTVTDCGAPIISTIGTGDYNNFYPTFDLDCIIKIYKK